MRSNCFCFNRNSTPSGSCSGLVFCVCRARCAGLALCKRLYKPMQTAPEASKAAPPKQSLYWQRALLWQSLGFLIIVVLTWSDALFDLTHAVLGLPHRSMDLGRTAITTVVIVLLWIFSAYKIYRVVSRL